MDATWERPPWLLTESQGPANQALPRGNSRAHCCCPAQRLGCKVETAGNPAFREQMKMGGQTPPTCICMGGALQGPGQLNSGRAARPVGSAAARFLPPHLWGLSRQGSPGLWDPVFYDVFLCRRRRPAFAGPGEGRQGGSAPASPQSAGAQGRPCRKADSLPNFSPGS